MDTIVTEDSMTGQDIYNYIYLDLDEVKMLDLCERVACEHNNDINSLDECIDIVLAEIDAHPYLYEIDEEVSNNEVDPAFASWEDCNQQFI